jgi:hypothetical protein
MTIKGAMIAASVAGLFAAGTAAAQSEKKSDEVMCSGVNSCKGHGACKGGGHSCAGKNGCKGQGLTKTTQDDCTAKGGKVAVAEKK